MHTQTLIIGGGLAGLSLAHRLQNAGRDYLLIEARTRLGGRIKSFDIDGTKFDLGPSWVWPGHDRVLQLIHALGLQTFDQFSTGDQLFEHTNGRIERSTEFMSMDGALRIAGGTTALTDAVAGQLDPERVISGVAAQSITAAASAALADGREIMADRIVLAIPPRLAAALSYNPALPQNAFLALQAISTWMGAQAKFLAVYSTPFWRDNGLSGDASSGRGPLAEIHDASPPDASFGALFGFVGLPAGVRAQAGKTLETAAIAQLGNLFGPIAQSPIATALEDWSTDPFTSMPADAVPPRGHPPYLMPADLSQIWDDTLIFAITEMAPDSGGFIEGALAASDAAATKILSQ